MINGEENAGRAFILSQSRGHIRAPHIVDVFGFDVAVMGLGAVGLSHSSRGQQIV